MSPIVGRRPRANPNAFATEVLGFLEPLYATALRLTRNRADAEDLVQDTLVKALRFSGRYERGTNLRAWLSTILHNTWKNRLRDASRDRVEVDSARVDEASVGSGGPRVSETPEQMLIRESLDADLRRALVRRCGCETWRSSLMPRSLVPSTCPSARSCRVFLADAVWSSSG
jgi:RNA polymerase sigma factor (sigma-70 family)